MLRKPAQHAEKAWERLESGSNQCMRFKRVCGASCMLSGEV